jgi:hypothetical protein
MQPRARTNVPSLLVSGALAMSATIALAFAFLVLFSLSTALRARGDDLQAWLLSWIPPSCCVTNQCCFQVKSTDVRSMPGDQWLILASGQTIRRSGWSPDGNYWRCACEQQSGRWVIFPAAWTRCLFVPMPNS